MQNMEVSRATHPFARSFSDAEVVYLHLSLRLRRVPHCGRIVGGQDFDRYGHYEMSYDKT